MFKVNNKDTRTTHQRGFGVFIDKSEHISKPMFNISIVDFELAFVSWVLHTINRMSIGRSVIALKV